MNNVNPKVFISHAGEDKVRFVEKFASKLLGKGVDPWYSTWEIKPGDRLVQKIFNEGIKDSSCFIIILSKFSNKPWVIKELEIAVVKQIEKNYKIIPVIIDNVEVPQCISEIYHRTIKDLENYDTELNEIVDSIFDLYKKPPISKSPRYVTIDNNYLPQLNKIDNIVLKIICQYLIETDYYHIDVEALEKKTNEIDLPFETVVESISFLDKNNFVKASFCSGPDTFTVVYPSAYGFIEYLKATRNDFNELMKSVLVFLDNHDIITVQELATSLKESKVLVRYLCKYLEGLNLCSTQDLTSNITLVKGESPSIKRFLKEN